MLKQRLYNINKNNEVQYIADLYDDNTLHIININNLDPDSLYIMGSKTGLITDQEILKKIQLIIHTK